MSNTKVEDAILQTIDLIASKRIAAAGYNKTILVTIVACENESSGKYKAKYQDGYFYVYGDPDIYYAPGLRVQVLVPNGDMSKDKTIMGTVRVLGTNYETITNEELIYDTIGRNIILNSESFSIDLSSYKTEVQILYDKSQSDNLLEIDIEEAEEYIKQSSSIKLSAIISTNLDILQRYNGDYGIVLGLNFKDNAAEEPITRYYVMNIDTMTGNPYFYPNATLQSKVFEIDNKNFVDIDTISVYTKDFPIQNEYSLVYDIHMRDLSLGSVRILSSDDLKGYSLNLITRKGYIFTADSLSTDTRTFEAQLRAQSKLIAMDSNEVSIYWFIQNVSVTAANLKYSSYGGQGWECLNDYKVVKEAILLGGIIVEPRVIEYIPGSAILTIQKTDVLTRLTKYKCVVIYGNNRLDKEFSVIRRDADYLIIITSDSGTEFYYDIGSPTLTCTCYHKENDLMIAVDPENLKFVWGTTDSSGVFESLPDQSINTDKVKLKAIQSAIELLLNIEYILYELYYDVTKVFIDDTVINNTQDATLRELLRSIKQSLVDVGITRIEDISNLFFTYNVEVIPNVTTYNLLLYGNSAHPDTLIKAINNLSDSQNVVKNKVIDVNIKRITGFSIFKCSVFTKVGNYFIGTGDIIVTNSLSALNLYTLIINNGSQVFKYSTTGISPTSKRNEIPLVIPSLSFTIYDNLGNPIELKDIERAEISWIVPSTQTMLEISSEYSGIPDSTLTNMIYNDLKTFNYGIVLKYTMDYNRNNITLKVNYNDMNLVATTNLTFTKLGEDGTNGTDFTCKIVPAVETGDVPLYPTIYWMGLYNTRLNWNPGSGNPWFQVQLWNNGNEPIFTGTDSGPSTENKQVNVVKWEVLRNNYGGENSIYKDVTNLTVTPPQGNAGWTFGFSGAGFPVSTPETWQTWRPANILKVTVSYDGHSFYATLPIIVCYCPYINYDISLKEYTGFRRVLYNSAGLIPSYDTRSPFEVIVKQQLIPNHWEDISLKESDQYALKYQWYYQGSVLYQQADDSVLGYRWVLDYELTILPQGATLISNIEESSKKWLMKAVYRQGAALEKNQKCIKPAEKYDGECVNTGLSCKIIRKSDNIAIGWIHFPIHMSFNRFENSAINDWDGNSVNLGEDNGGMIIAPQVGAGEKDSNNRFTGLFMGTAKDPSANSYGSSARDNHDVGLFGYNSGVRTIFLDSKTGKAVFGEQGQGQIIIDPSERDPLTLKPKAQIKSGNFEEGANGSGMLIDLSTPAIKFGSGNFSVDKDGKLYCKGAIIDGYTTVNDVNSLLSVSSLGILLQVSQNYSTKQETQQAISSITIEPSTIRLATGNLSWEATNSTLTPDGTFSCQNATIRGDLLLGTEESGFLGGVKESKHPRKTTGIVWPENMCFVLEHQKTYNTWGSTLPCVGQYGIAVDAGGGVETWSIISGGLNFGNYVLFPSSATVLTTGNYGKLEYTPTALEYEGGLYSRSSTWNKHTFKVSQRGIEGSSTGGGYTLTGEILVSGKLRSDDTTGNIEIRATSSSGVQATQRFYMLPGSSVYPGEWGITSKGQGLISNGNRLTYMGSLVALGSTSSLRYKNNITLIKNKDLNPHNLYKLKVVQYKYNDGIRLQYPDMKDKFLPGFIAEDVDKIYPAAVIHHYSTGLIESWDERRIIPGMLALIQLQNERINQLEKMVKEIKGE